MVSSKSFSQTPSLEQMIQQVSLFLNDAVLYSDKYITPATDAAVYQASSGWMTSPKKRKLFDVPLAINTNVFFVPHRDRSFQINKSDFSFFSIQNANGENVTSATVPTALGSDTNYSSPKRRKSRINYLSLCSRIYFVVERI